MSGKAFFLADIVGRSRNCADRDDFSALDAGSFVDDDVEEFSTATINSAEDGTSETKENGRLGWNAIDCCGDPVADKVDDLSFLNE